MKWIFNKISNRIFSLIFFSFLISSAIYPIKSLANFPQSNSNNVTASGSFESGEEFTSLQIQGRLFVDCPGADGPAFGSTNCNLDYLNPTGFTAFVGPKIESDKVSLEATYENGSTSKIQYLPYNYKNGVSTQKINLWTNTVFQRPFLKLGKNSVEFKLFKKGKIVEKGNFTVNVLEGGFKTCPRSGYYTSPTSADCSSPQLLCNRYFNEHNYCQ